jgi:hypothetical protein
MSVSGTFRSKARRFTSTTSPSSRFGCIEAEGIGFQSATAVRNTPNRSRKARKPLLLRTKFFTAGLLGLIVTRTYTLY